eukprot:831927-Rhodomonas_salina.1
MKNKRKKKAQRAPPVHADAALALEHDALQAEGREHAERRGHGEVDGEEKERASPVLRWSAKRTRCLLYTSDAADDM